MPRAVNPVSRSKRQGTIMTKPLRSVFLGLILVGGSGCGAFRLSRCSWPSSAFYTAPIAPTRCGRTAIVAAGSTCPSPTARITAAGLRAAWEGDLFEFDAVLSEDAGVRAPAGAGGGSPLGGASPRRAAAVSLGSSRDPRQSRARGSSRVVLVSSSSSAAAAPPASRREELLTDSSASDIAVADDGDGDDPFDSALESAERVSKIRQIQERPQTASDRLRKMDLQDIALTLVLPSIAAYAAGRFVYNKVAGRVGARTGTLLDAFAKEMIYHDGDFDEMALCARDYRGRLVYLGPLRDDRMLKSYLEAYAKRKTISPQAVSSLSYAFTLFGLSEEAAAKLLVSLCRDMGTDKIASAGKLLFLGSRILRSPEGAAALRPIKDLIKSTYREASVADEMVETSQQFMAEASYRSAVQAGGKDQKALTVGWEVLGLDRAAAERIFKEEAREGFVTAREAMYGLQTQKYDKKGRRIDKEGGLENPEEADQDEDGNADDGPVSNVYECSECGFTLFVAQGRESKFFGQDFKCPECGAPKDKFKARDDLDE